MCLQWQETECRMTKVHERHAKKQRCFLHIPVMLVSRSWLLLELFTGSEAFSDLENRTFFQN